MLFAQALAHPTAVLSPEAIQQTLLEGLTGRYAGARVLVIIPDHTRTLPLAQCFPWIMEGLAGARQVDILVALGTHPPLSQEHIGQLLGLTPAERDQRYPGMRWYNHAWQDPSALVKLGTLTQAEVQGWAGEVWHPSLGGDVPIEINKLILDYDAALLVSPVFPHEVVGFSGGAKYLFPGIAGEAMINVTHWLGALLTILKTIGLAETPMRQMIHAAAAYVPTPVQMIGMVVVKEGLAGLMVGEMLETWAAAAQLSAQRHIIWLDKPFERVLSQAPSMYDELWTAAKAMYKLEPAIADGGEVVVYAPHLGEVSTVHGRYLYDIGYHVRDYFLADWARFQHVPLGVLAHSTHLRGSGQMVNGVEKARIAVTLASRLSRADCQQLALGYADPEQIRPEEWTGREAEGLAYIPKAGEMLYRVRPA